MKLILALLLMFSPTANSQDSDVLEIRLARAALLSAQQHKAYLQEIHSGASRVATASRAAKWIGFGIPAFLATVATTGFIGFLFGSMGAGAYAYSTMNDNQYAEVRKIVESDFFTPEQKVLVARHLDILLKGDSKQKVYAEVEMLRLTSKRTKERLAVELAKEEYSLDGGSYLSRPQRVANYIELQIAMADFEIGIQEQIIKHLELLQRQR